MPENRTLNDVLSALDPRGIEDFPAQLGAFDLESLCVTFNFTRQQHLDALASVGAAVRAGLELPEHVKTIIHETTHLFHTLTTPLGVLIHRLRRLQARLVVEAIREIVRGGVQPGFPLYVMRGRVPGKAGERFESHLRLWYAVELYVLILLGEIDAWKRQLQKNTLINTINVTVMYSIIQYYLSIHIRELQRGSISDDLLKTEPPFTVYAHEDIDVSVQEKFWAMILPTDMLSGGANTLGIIESAGTVSEYYGSRSLDLQTWKDRVAAKPSVRTGPQSWLLWAFHIRARSLPEFLHAYLGICELTLFAPLLPEHRPLRQGKIDFHELMPFVRWFKLKNAAADIDPPTSPPDYRRYVDQLAIGARWPTITKIAESAVQIGNTVPLDPVEQIYRKAQQMRLEHPSIFLNYPFFVFPATPEHLAMRLDFEFPVIKYTDKILFLTDKEKLNNIILFYLNRLATRILVLRDKLDLPLPYDPVDEERVFYAGAIHEILTSTTGAAIPKVTIQ